MGHLSPRHSFRGRQHRRQKQPPDLTPPNCNGRECFASVLYSFLAIANREVARRFAIAMVRRLVLSHIRGSARSHMPPLIWLCAARLVTLRNAITSVLPVGRQY